MVPMDVLLGRPQHYDWGSLTAIPRLMHIEPDGRPWAEVWYGAHPTAPSLIDGQPLDTILTEHPEQIGPASVDQFGRRLPFLLKLLAADRSLSLQAHPSREQAEAGYAREDEAGVAIDARERLYVDDWPKPEIICAIEEFHALCGFRDPHETADLFEDLGAEQAIAATACLRSLPADEALREVTGRFLSDDGTLLRDILAAATRVADDSPISPFADTALELSKQHPGDPGIAVALLMNRLTLQPGQAIFLPAAILHAYLRGLGVELMANSNNVLRGGLTSKHVDVGELRSQLDFRPYHPEILTGTEVATGVWHYDTPAPEFALWRLGDGATVPADSLGRILLATGPATLDGASTLSLRPGEAAWLAAGERATIQGTGPVWMAAAGI